MPLSAVVARRRVAHRRLRLSAPRRRASSQFQGWVEAYFIFVSPDEAGRVETLSVREGDAVTAGAPLFTLDADLQRAAVAENEAAVANAKVTFERAQELLKRAVGSQKAFDDAEAALRTAEARLNSARTRLERRRVASPAAGTRPGGLLPGRARWCRPAGRSCRCCRRTTYECASSCRRRCCRKVHIGDRDRRALRRLRAAT